MKKYLPLWLKLKNNFHKIILIIFLCTIGYLLYTNLGRDALFDWDEGIYAELGRQVLVTKNLFTTYWNDSPWLEKPPGVAWASAFGILLFGETSYGARFIMPLIAIYTLYIVYRIGTHLGSKSHGLIAAGVLASFNLFLGRTRAVNTDMALLASITTTVLFLLENRPAWWVALSIFGGVWFKGIAGLMSVIIALPLLLSKSKRYISLVTCYLSLLIIPWHLYSYLKYNHDFLTPYFFEQVLRRATAQIEFHFENRWYYFNYLYENLGLGVLIVAGIGGLLSFFKKKNFYLLWWVIAPLSIFTLAKTRLFWYILPVYPALSLLIADAIGNFQESRLGKKVVLILTIGVLIQAILTTSRSVELNKTFANMPDRLLVAVKLANLEGTTLSVLVPRSERLSEALLPDIARLTSSFRYGGMPSLAFYYRGHLNFYYDVDKFIEDWEGGVIDLALVSVEDIPLISKDYVIRESTLTYLGIVKDSYAHR